MMNKENINYEYKKLCPFKWFVLENFPFIEADFDALTNWQLFCKLGQEMNKIITSVNLSGEQIEKLTESFNNLQTYVNNYFINLDVQEEINNKLDKMASDGSLAKIINQDIFNDLNTKINNIETQLTEELTATFLSGGKNIDLGDCCVILGTKNIIIDLGFDNQCTQLRNFLNEKNVKKIDAIIISHFHSDHIGQVSGLTALLNENIDFSNCSVYLPHKGINYNQFQGTEKTTIQANETQFISVLQEKNINYIYPNEADKIELTKNLSLEFYNINFEYYNDYYNYLYDAYENLTSNTNYNNFSMITILKHYNNYFCFTSDIEKLAQSKNYKVFKKCDVLKVEHHSLNYDSNIDYLNQLNPSIAVICNRNYLTPTTYTHNTYYTLKQKGVSIYNTSDSGNITIKSINNKLISSAEIKSPIYNVNYNLYEGKPLLPGDDLDNFITPGIYYSKNGSNTNQLINQPNVGAGFKLIVEKVSVLDRTIKQTILSSNNPYCNMFYREKLEGVWQPWLTQYFSVTRFKKLESSDFNYNVTLNDTNNINRARILNKICEVSLDFTTKESINSYTNILTLPVELYDNENTTFILASSDNLLYPCYIAHQNNLPHVRCTKDIPSGAHLYGSVHYIQPATQLIPN